MSQAVHIHRSVGELPGITQPVRYPSGLPSTAHQTSGPADFAAQRSAYGQGLIYTSSESLSHLSAAAHNLSAPYTSSIPGARNMLLLNGPQRAESNERHLSHLQHAHNLPSGSNFYTQPPTLLRVGSYPSLLPAHPSSVFTAHSINSTPHHPSSSKPQPHPSNPQPLALQPNIIDTGRFPTTMPLSFSTHPQYMQPSHFAIIRGTPHAILQVPQGHNPQHSGMILMGAPPGMRIIQAPNGQQQLFPHYPSQPRSAPPPAPSTLNRLQPGSRLDLTHTSSAPASHHLPPSTTSSHRAPLHHPTDAHPTASPPRHHEPDHPTGQPLSLHPQLVFPSGSHLPPHMYQAHMHGMSAGEAPKLIRYQGNLMQLIPTQQHIARHNPHAGPSAGATHQPSASLSAHGNGQPMFMMHMPMMYATPPMDQPQQPQQRVTVHQHPPVSSAFPPAAPIPQQHIQPAASAPPPAPASRKRHHSASPRAPSQPRSRQTTPPSDKPKKRSKREGADHVSPDVSPPAFGALRAEASSAPQTAAASDALQCADCGRELPQGAFKRDVGGVLRQPPCCQDCASVQECTECGMLQALSQFRTAGGAAGVCAQCAAAAGSGDARTCAQCGHMRPAHAYAYVSELEEQQGGVVVCLACKSKQAAQLPPRPMPCLLQEDALLQGGCPAEPHAGGSKDAGRVRREGRGGEARASWGGSPGRLPVAAAVDSHGVNMSDEAVIVVVDSGRTRSEVGTVKDEPVTCSSSRVAGAGGVAVEERASPGRGAAPAAGGSGGGRGCGARPAAARSGRKVDVKQEAHTPRATEVKREPQLGGMGPSVEAAGRVEPRPAEVSNCARSRPFSPALSKGAAAGSRMHEEGGSHQRQLHHSGALSPSSSSDRRLASGGSAPRPLGSAAALSRSPGASTVSSDRGDGVKKPRSVNLVAAGGVHLTAGDMRAKLREVAMRAAAAAHLQDAASSGQHSRPGSPLADAAQGTARAPGGQPDTWPGSEGCRPHAAASKLSASSTAVWVKEEAGWRAGDRHTEDAVPHARGSDGGGAGQLQPWAASIHLLAQAAAQVEAMDELGEVQARRARRGTPLRRGWMDPQKENVWKLWGTRQVPKGARAERARKGRWRHKVLGVALAHW